jgi:HAD superfamily hydrolase (TIGR01509 family)
VAAKLKRILGAEGVEPPRELDRDPLKVLQWVGAMHPALTQQVEDVLVAEETTAAESSKPTPGAVAVIVAARTHQHPVAIVSNNSATAIETYLNAHRLLRWPTVIVGRPYGQPDRMKPSPDMVLLAVERLGAVATSCALVGDSPTDMQAATAAGVLPVGYAKTPDRRTGLLDAGAAAVIDDMQVLVSAWATT